MTGKNIFSETNNFHTQNLNPNSIQNLVPEPWLIKTKTWPLKI